MTFKKSLYWLNAVTCVLMFIMIVIGNLPTGFVFFLATIWLAAPTFLTGRALREIVSNSITKQLLLFNVLFVLIVMGYCIWRAIEGYPQAFILGIFVSFTSMVNIYMLIKRPELFSESSINNATHT
jgi:hypothetical protein